MPPVLSLLAVFIHDSFRIKQYHVMCHSAPSGRPMPSFRVDNEEEIWVEEASEKVLLRILNDRRQEMKSQFAKTTQEFISNHGGNVAGSHRMQQLTDSIISSPAEAISDGEEVRGRGAIEASDSWGPLNEPSEVNDRTDSSEAFIGEDRLKYLVVAYMHAQIGHVQGWNEMRAIGRALVCLSRSCDGEMATS